MVKIKRRKMITIGGSVGFIVPTSYLKERMDGGLELEKEYDIDIQEVEDAETEN